MITAARLLGLAAGATLLAAGTSVELASAQDQRCKSEAVTVTGRAKFRPFTKTKELEGRGSAMADAIKTWQREVTSRYGARWGKWSEADDTSRNCAPTKSGKIIGTSFIGCTISGRPCATAASAEDGPEKDGDAKAAAADDRDTSDRDTTITWSPAYRHEMARQDRLAAERRRAAARAWKREEQRQRYLKQQRNRDEARARARADARYGDDD